MVSTQYSCMGPKSLRMQSRLVSRLLPSDSLALELQGLMGVFKSWLAGGGSGGGVFIVGILQPGSVRTVVGTVELHCIRRGEVSYLYRNFAPSTGR